MNLKDLYNVDYRIELELKIRKLLESSTSYIYEFHKNETDTHDDIVVFKYVVRDNSHDKLLLGYIEIEISTVAWINEYPSYWKEISYLKRKIFQFDWSKNFFLKEPVENYERSLYVKFNKTITDCHFNTKKYIFENFKDSERNGKIKDLRIYNDAYYSVSYKDKEKHTQFGIENLLRKTVIWLNTLEGIKINKII
jgi:hypothetical protein